MGRSSSFDELGRKLAEVADRLEHLTPATVRAATDRAAEVVESEIRMRVPDLDMSGVSRGRKRGRVGVRVTRPRSTGDDTAAFAVRAVGAVHWLERGTDAHLIGTGTGKRAGYRRARASFMKAAGAAHPVRGPLAHPGMRAGHTWSKGVDRATPAAAEVFRRRAVADVTEPFR